MLPAATWWSGTSASASSSSPSTNLSSMAASSMKRTTKDGPEGSLNLGSLRATLANNFKPLNWPAPPDRVKVIRKKTTDVSAESTSFYRPRVVLEYLNSRRPQFPTREAARASFRTIEESLGCEVEEVLIRAGPEHRRMRSIMRIRGPGGRRSDGSVDEATRSTIRQGTDARHVDAPTQTHHVAGTGRDVVGGAVRVNGPQISLAGSAPNEDNHLVAGDVENTTDLSIDTSSGAAPHQHSTDRAVTIHGPLGGILDKTDKERLKDEMVLGMLEFGYPFRGAGKKATQAKKKKEDASAPIVTTTGEGRVDITPFKYPKLPASARFIVAIDGDIDEDYDGKDLQLPSNARLILTIDEKDLDLLAAEEEKVGTSETRATKDEVTKDEVTKDEVTKDEVTQDEAPQDEAPQDEMLQEEAVHQEATQGDDSQLKTPSEQQRKNPLQEFVRSRIRVFRPQDADEGEFVFRTPRSTEFKRRLSEPSGEPLRKRAREDNDDDLYILPKMPVSMPKKAEEPEVSSSSEEDPSKVEAVGGDEEEDVEAVDNGPHHNNESTKESDSTVTMEESQVCTDLILSPRRPVQRPATPPLEDSCPQVTAPKRNPLIILPPQNMQELSPPPSEPTSPIAENDSEIIVAPRDSKPMSVSTPWGTEGDVFSDHHPHIERPITPASSIRSVDSRRWSTFSRFSTNTGLTTPPPTRPGSAVNTPATTPMKLLTWTDEFAKGETVLDGIGSGRQYFSYQTPTKPRRPLLSEMRFETVTKLQRPPMRRWSSHLVRVHTRIQSPILLSPPEELVASIEEGYMFPMPEPEVESPSPLARKSSRRKARETTVVELGTEEEFQTVRELFDELSDVEEEIHRLSESEDDDEDEIEESRIVELNDDEKIETDVRGGKEKKRDRLLRRLRERARKLKTKVVTAVKGGKRLSSVPKESTPAVVVV